MTAKEYLIEVSEYEDYYNKLTEEECLQELICSHKTIRQTFIDRPEKNCL